MKYLFFSVLGMISILYTSLYNALEKWIPLMWGNKRHLCPVYMANIQSNLYFRTYICTAAYWCCHFPIHCPIMVHFLLISRAVCNKEQFKHKDSQLAQHEILLRDKRCAMWQQIQPVSIQVWEISGAPAICLHLFVKLGWIAALHEWCMSLVQEISDRCKLKSIIASC